MTHEKRRCGSGNRPKNCPQSNSRFCQDFPRRFVVKPVAKEPLSSRFVPSVPGFKIALSNLSDASGTAHSLTYLLTQKTATL